MAVRLKKPVTAPQNNLYLLPLPWFDAIAHLSESPPYYHPSDKLESKEQGSRLPDPCHRSLPGSPAATLGNGQRQVFGCRYPAAVAGHRAF
jgi:hypothetical protein